MFIGLDIGATKIRGGLLDRKFKVVKVIEKPTQAAKGKQKVLENIFYVIRELDNQNVKSIGLAIRGQVDFKTDQVLESTMMPGKFKNVLLAKIINKKFKKKVIIDNDVNCFTLAESFLGVGKDKACVVGLTLGTGIGGGVVINGRIFHGAHGAAGEIGHMIIDPSFYKWNCRQKGCFESLCSGAALIKQYKIKTGKILDSFEIEKRFKKNDKAAREVFFQMSNYLAIGLANIIHILDPDIIVIGGGFASVKFYVNPAIKQVKKHLIYNNLKKTPIKFAKLGNQAGIIGAALLWQQKD